MRYSQEALVLRDPERVSSCEVLAPRDETPAMRFQAIRQARQGQRRCRLPLCSSSRWVVKVASQLPPIFTRRPPRTQTDRYVYNAPKVTLAKHIASQMGWPTLKVRTLPYAAKFNIWVWDPTVKRRARPNS
jgi:hypothetical protein